MIFFINELFCFQLMLLTLKILQESLPNPEKCKQDNTGAEDVEIGKCLLSVGVDPGDSRDKQGRSTFLPLYINSFLIPGTLTKDFWFWSYIYYPFNEVPVHRNLVWFVSDLLGTF